MALTNHKPLLLQQRQNNRYRRSLTNLAPGFGCAAMQLRDVLDDRKSEPSSAQFTTPSLVYSIKSLKDPRQVLRPNANPLIGNTYPDPIIVSGCAETDFSSWFGVFNRVIKEIVDYFLKPVLVRRQIRHVLGDLKSRP